MILIVDLPASPDEQISGYVHEILDGDVWLVDPKKLITVGYSSNHPTYAIDGARKRTVDWTDRRE